MKKIYVAPNTELVGIRLSQGILDLIIDTGLPLGSGEEAAAKKQTYLEDDVEDENEISVVLPKLTYNVWDEEDEE